MTAREAREGYGAAAGELELGIPAPAFPGQQALSAPVGKGRGDRIRHRAEGHWSSPFPSLIRFREEGGAATSGSLRFPCVGGECRPNSEPSTSSAPAERVHPPGYRFAPTRGEYYRVSWRRTECGGHPGPRGLPRRRRRNPEARDLVQRLRFGEQTLAFRNFQQGLEFKGVGENHRFERHGLPASEDLGHVTLCAAWLCPTPAAPPATPRRSGAAAAPASRSAARRGRRAASRLDPPMRPPRRFVPIKNLLVPHR